MWKLSADEKAATVQRYIAGESSTAIAASVGVSPTAVLGIVRRRGVAIRSQSVAATRCTLRHDAFDKLAPDALYWIGFIFADGTVVHRTGAPEVALVLSARDRQHVERFRSFLGSSHQIVEVARRGFDARGAVRLAVRSESLVAALEAHGYIGTAPTRAPSRELAASPDFWRGVVDGDGSLGVYNGYAQLRLVGERRLLDDYVRYVRTVAPLCRVTVRPHKSIYCVALCGVHAVALARALYEGDGPALARKHNAAINILNRAGAGPVVEAAHVAV